MSLDSTRAPQGCSNEGLTAARVFTRNLSFLVQIDSRPGGEWALFGGNVEGKFVELVPGKKIVQTWRFASWPAGIGCASRLIFFFVLSYILKMATAVRTIWGSFLDDGS
jgi:activator of HSP90 ATPase